MVITPTESNAYQNKLDETLPRNEELADDERIDIFLIEADYALKYVNSEYSLDIINEVGLTERTRNQYQYTRTSSSADGVLKLRQATPGLSPIEEALRKKCWERTIHRSSEKASDWKNSRKSLSR